MFNEAKSALDRPECEKINRDKTKKTTSHKIVSYRNVENKESLHFAGLRHIVNSCLLACSLI
jgi:hypothetical protein